MIEIHEHERSEDTAGELYILTTQTDRALIRAGVHAILTCAEIGIFNMQREDLVDLVEFSNRFNAEVERNCK